MSDQLHVSTNQRADPPLFTPASASAVQLQPSHVINRRDYEAGLDYDWLPVLFCTFSQQDQLHLTGRSDGCFIFIEEKRGNRRRKHSIWSSVSHLKSINGWNLNWILLLHSFCIFTLLVHRLRWGCSSVMGLRAMGGVTDVA